MAHHKRGKVKSRRAGCLFCKPWKHQRAAKIERTPVSARRRLQSVDAFDLEVDE